MPPEVAHDLNDADKRILELLAGGRNLPQNLAERLGYSRQYIQNRLQMLKAADYVTRHGGGLYEITDDGREEIGVATTDEPDLRAELQDALEARDDAQARADRLEGKLKDHQALLDDCQERLSEKDVDVPALRRALDDIEGAAERGDGDALRDALERARGVADDV